MDGELLTIGYIGIWREMTTLKRVVKWMKKYRKLPKQMWSARNRAIFRKDPKKKKKEKKKNRNTLL